MGPPAATPEVGTLVEVRVAGRLTALRRHGKSTFANLTDLSGQIQLYFQQDLLGEAGYRVAQLLDVGDLVGVRGGLGRTRTGELTIFANELSVLAKALRPLPEKWHGLKDVELRSRQRYLDLIANAEVRERFVQRSRVLAAVREYLSAQGFLEVETPMMHAVAGGAAARPFITHHNALDLNLYLRIAPELYLKRLLVGGLERVFEVNRNFRNEGISLKHNPEFTMLEAYQAYGDYRTMMELTEELITFVRERAAPSGSSWMRTVGGTRVQGSTSAAGGSAPKETESPEVTDFGGATIHWARPWARREFADLFAHYVGFAMEDRERARRAAQAAEVPTEGREHWELVADLFGRFVEAHLLDPTFVLHYPVATSPLARARADNPELAERFELYVGGMELVNAFTELNDPVEQRQRFTEQLADTAGEWARLDEDFVRALEYGMPPAGGLGLGIDRLVMLLLGVTSIREVILFPLLRPREEVEERPER
jgi:lysyl-tRNA synthetase class 2